MSPKLEAGWWTMAILVSVAAIVAICAFVPWLGASIIIGLTFMVVVGLIYSIVLDGIKRREANKREKEEWIRNYEMSTTFTSVEGYEQRL